MACKPPVSSRNSGSAPASAGLRPAGSARSPTTWRTPSGTAAACRDTAVTRRSASASARVNGRLRALVRDGLVWREVEPTTPPQVTDGLTEFGRDVGEPLTEPFDRITRRLSPHGTG